MSIPDNDLQDTAALARLGLKVFANNDQTSAGQIAQAARALDAFISWKDAEIQRRQTSDPTPATEG